MYGILFSIVFIFATFCFCAASEFDYTIEIRPGKYECYFQPVSNPKHKTMEIDYQVIDGGDLDVNFMVIYGADMIVQDHKKTEANHKIQVQGQGDYQFCFDNTFSYQARKVVYFEVFLMDEHGNVEDVDVGQYGQVDEKTKEKLKDLGMTMESFAQGTNKIKGNLNRVEYYQSVLRSYEHRDKAIMNANHSRVTFWSFINTVVLFVVAVLQVYTIRSLFEENSKAKMPLIRPLSFILCFLLISTTISQVKVNFDEPKEEVIMVLKVEPGKIDCFYERLNNPKHVQIETDFQVTEGGELDISFHVKNPKGLIVAKDYKQINGEHKINLEHPNNGHGEYEFCFDNSFSTTTAKTVYFELFLLDKDGNFIQERDLKMFTNDSISERVAGFDRITLKLKRDMNEIEKHQTHIRAVESRDRSIVEHNFERVNFWSVLNTVAIFLMTLLQIYTIRALLTEDSKVGRVLRKGRLND
ncbi:unnamed protein product [Bursaphelenchus okinawaensis]|uniref:GOLD domain-containing protein n=1 Tax=Bursaphelenchus okinawaensis TaxID=465554 RepID=A0A811KY05_9BILA|nr:unnamed protein product [Bursaphelenchus okinawaensis]CAG9113684.1 unnamed protein product [Bursaphelenchus okinawaensis]